MVHVGVALGPVLRLSFVLVLFVELDEGLPRRRGGLRLLEAYLCVVVLGGALPHVHLHSCALSSIALVLGVLRIAALDHVLITLLTQWRLVLVNIVMYRSGDVYPVVAGIDGFDGQLGFLLLGSKHVECLRPDAGDT